MAVQESYLRAPASTVLRIARTASVVLLALTIAFLLGSDLSASSALLTQPLEAISFLLMLLGLAIAWEHPLHGGILTALTWAMLGIASRGRLELPLAAFLAVGLLDLVAGLRERRTPVRA